jgi:hypothetical protein
LTEMCGNNLGRCYKLCRVGDNAACAPGVCGTQVELADGSNSGQRVCSLGDETCDPYARTGCADPALNCYVTGPNQTTCDCPSSIGPQAQEGDACVAYNDCAVGLACLQVGGAPRCLKLCQSAADCPNSSCMVFGSSGSYCALTD